MDYAASLSRLQRLCSKAEYCSADVYRKALKDLDGDASQAAQLVSCLVEEHYVDDARYAAAFAREKASLQGWGPIKIRVQLRAKGVSDDAIDAGLSEVDAARASERLERLLAAKARTLEGDPQRRLKLLKFALSRGYEYGPVEEALQNLENRA